MQTRNSQLQLTATTTEYPCLKRNGKLVFLLILPKYGVRKVCISFTSPPPRVFQLLWHQVKKTLLVGVCGWCLIPLFCRCLVNFTGKSLKKYFFNINYNLLIHFGKLVKVYRVHFVMTDFASGTSSIKRLEDFLDLSTG